MAYTTTTDVYQIAGIPSDGSVVSDADIEAHIASAESYVERMLGTNFQVGGKQVTETYDGDDQDFMFLNNYPIISLDTVTIDSTSVTTSKIWKWDHTGKIRLKTTAEKTRFTSREPQLISITYTYGQTADARVVHFTAAVAAVMTLIEQIGGTFDDITSFQLPEMSGSLGEPYTNIREALARLQTQLPNLQKYLPIKPRFG